MASQVRTALIIVSFGSADLVDQNATGLAADWPELDVVIVDCFSGADERARVGDLCERRGWTAVLLDHNAGFGGGVNRGAEVALERGAEALLVLNPDAVLPATAARALSAHVGSEPSVLVAPVIRRPDGSLWTEGVDLYLDDGTMAGIRHRDRHTGRPRMMWVSGACFAVSASLWLQVGGFEESYFLYWEDVDLCRKVLDTGGDVQVLESAFAVHDEGGTHTDREPGRAKSETYYYFNIRNRMLFAQLRLSSADTTRWSRCARRVAWQIVLQGGRRQLVTSVAPWRALTRGLRDGRLGVTGPMPAGHRFRRTG